MTGVPDSSEKMRAQSIQQMLQGAILHLLVMAAGLLFNCFRLSDKRFRRAVEGFDAVYVFRTPSASRSMVFGRGRIRTRRKSAGTPDYEIILLDPPGALKALMENPNDPVTLVVENKINQRGNLFFLYKLGYLAGLCEARIRSLASVPGVLRRRPAGSGATH